VVAGPQGSGTEKNWISQHQRKRKRSTKTLRRRGVSGGRGDFNLNEAGKLPQGGEFVGSEDVGKERGTTNCERIGGGFQKKTTSRQYCVGVRRGASGSMCTCTVCHGSEGLRAVSGGEDKDGRYNTRKRAQNRSLERRRCEINIAGMLRDTLLP